MSSLKVRNIISTEGDFSHVVIDYDTFNLVKGANPTLPQTTDVRDAQNRRVRVFSVDGITLFSRYTNVDGEPKTEFFMSKSDAQACLTTREDETKALPQLDIRF